MRQNLPLLNKDFRGPITGLGVGGSGRVRHRGEGKKRLGFLEGRKIEEEKNDPNSIWVQIATGTMNIL